ncbi:MAG: hypothetical protein NTW20_09645 [Rhodobacterales bacterium]|nr:hypothetical protein [Rhodobacterales bacterium]
MTVTHPAFIAIALTLSISGCVPTAPLGPMSDPSMGYSGQEISAATGIPTAMLRNDEQCKVSARVLADPTSTPNERYGATTAARANACPGY